MKKGVESNVLQDGASSIGIVGGIIKKYPARVLGVCGLLALSVPSLREHAGQTGQKAINFLDEHWRRTMHPGYRGNGQYSADGPTYYRDAVKQGYVDVQD